MGLTGLWLPFIALPVFLAVVVDSWWWAVPEPPSSELSQVLLLQQQLINLCERAVTARDRAPAAGTDARTLFLVFTLGLAVGIATSLWWVLRAGKLPGRDGAVATATVHTQVFPQQPQAQLQSGGAPAPSARPSGGFSEETEISTLVTVPAPVFTPRRRRGVVHN